MVMPCGAGGEKFLVGQRRWLCLMYAEMPWKLIVIALHRHWAKRLDGCRKDCDVHLVPYQAARVPYAGVW